MQRRGVTPTGKAAGAQMKKVLAWLAVPLAICLVVAGFLVAQWIKPIAVPQVEATAESRDTQVITSMSRQEQIVLLRLGIQGISVKEGNSTFMGVNIPGSKRAAFVQYNFNAKLGIDGKDVKITSTGDKQFTVTIPRFIFIGHSDETFQLIAEKNGVLSGLTPEIDTAKMITNLLDEKAQAEYLSKNDDVLKDQAKTFYTSLATGIDPSVQLSVEFPAQ